MARGQRLNGERPEEDATIHQAQENGFDGELVLDYIEKVERKDATIDAIHAKATKEAQPHVDGRKRIIKEAAEKAGIPRTEFRALLRKRKLEKRAKAVKDSLNENQQVTFEQLEFSLTQVKGTGSKKAGAKGEGAEASA